MFRHNRKVDRNYKKPFFSRKQNYGRLYFVVVMLVLIVGLPIVAFWQEDAIQEQILLNAGIAPTATPFAGERAAMGQDYYRSGDMASAARYYQMAVQQQPENIS